MSDEDGPVKGASETPGSGTEPPSDAKEQSGAAARKPDPLHGVTLAMMLEKLVDKYGWPGLAKRIRINCFASEPSIASSLSFLRRTPWAREKVQDLYLYAFHGVMKPPSAWTLRGRELRAGKGRPAAGPEASRKAPRNPASKARPDAANEERKGSAPPRPTPAKPVPEAPPAPAIAKPAPKSPQPKSPRNPHY